MKFFKIGKRKIVKTMHEITVDKKWISGYINNLKIRSIERGLLTERKKFCLKITNEIANWKSLKTKTLVLRFVEAEFKRGRVVMGFSRKNTYFSWILFGDIKNLKKLRNQKTFWSSLFCYQQLPCKQNVR